MYPANDPTGPRENIITNTENHCTPTNTGKLCPISDFLGGDHEKFSLLIYNAMYFRECLRKLLPHLNPIIENLV
jgi:hypothetical protein